MLTGEFTPTAEAKTLTTAPHFNNEATPITVRFSSSTGIPNIPDTDPNANPRGMALRFNLGTDSQGRRLHTDIVAHSTPYFPVQTGEDFLAFFQAILAGKVEDFLGSHPAALAFVQAPKPFPVSLATQPYFGVNAFKFISPEGKEQYFRYQIHPDAGEHYLTEADLKEKDRSYLWEELHSAAPNSPISFGVYAQLAEEGDKVEDSTIRWPETRKLVRLGTAKLDSILKDSLKQQKYDIFDPVPRHISGLEASKDPLIDMRAAVYLISGRERRAAPETTEGA